MSEPLTAFSTLVTQAAQASEANPMIIPPGWGQGRATFGGVVAAVLYAAMEQKVEAGRPVRSLSLSFVGPVAPGPVQLSVEILRQGRGVTQVEGRLLQNGEIQAVMLGSFGAPRESQVGYAAEPAPRVKAVDECPALPYIPKVVPEFTQQLQFRWAVGGMPFSGSTSREMGGWVRFAEPQPCSNAAVILGLVDAWPPAVLPALKSPAPASSLSWTIEFVQPMPAIKADEWLLYVASVDHARDGYGHVQARLWTTAGELIALSRQTVTVFA